MATLIDFDDAPSSIRHFTWIVGTIRGVFIRAGHAILDMGPGAFSVVRLHDRAFLACCQTEQRAMESLVAQLGVDRAITTEVLVDLVNGRPGALAVAQHHVRALGFQVPA